MFEKIITVLNNTRASLFRKNVDEVLASFIKISDELASVQQAMEKDLDAINDELMNLEGVKRVVASEYKRAEKIQKKFEDFLKG